MLLLYNGNHRINNILYFPNKEFSQSAVVISVSPFLGRHSIVEPDNEAQPVIVFHLWMRNAEGRRHDWCAVLNLTSACFHYRKIALVMLDVFESPISRSEGSECKMQESVLIPIIRIGEIQERVVWDKAAIAPIARLYKFDRCPHCCAQANLEPPLGIGVGLRGICPQGELNSVSLFGRSVGMLIYDNGPNQMVERTSEIMDYVREHQRPAGDVGLSVDMNDDLKASVLVVSFVDERIRYKLVPSVDLEIEAIEQFFGAA